MALTDDEYLDILRHLQERLREFAPDVFENLSEITVDLPPNPQTRLIRYLGFVIRTFKTRSSDTYPYILDLLNNNIKTKEGNSIESIKISFTPEEAQLYGIDEFDLVNLPDDSAFLDDLITILNSIQEDESDKS